MINRGCISALLLFVVCGASVALAVDVNVSSPSNNYNGPAPVHVVASASGDQRISGWVIYLDGKWVYSKAWTSSIDTNLSMDQGTHQVVIRAWDVWGRYDDRYLQVTANGDGGLPTPPDWAQVFNNVHKADKWGSCHNPECAGGSGDGVFWMNEDNREPSMSGASTQFYNSGIWANALWWHHLGPNNDARNFLADYWVYVDDVSQRATQTLEFEPFQFIDGWNYMMGTQCGYGYKFWDTWDQAEGRWKHTNIPCRGLTPWKWHHIQWYMTTDPDSHTYTYVTFVLDGKSYPLNITRKAGWTGWKNNTGVQWQLDVNATGAGYHIWVDKASLTVW